MIRRLLFAGGFNGAQHTAPYQPAHQANRIPIGGKPPPAGVVGAEDARFRHQTTAPTLGGAHDITQRQFGDAGLREGQKPRPVGDLLQAVFSLPKSADQP